MGFLKKKVIFTMSEFFCIQCYGWQMQHIFQAAVVQLKWQEGQADYQGKSEMLIT